MSDLTQSEEVTYLTKTAYTDGLKYLQDNFVTKSGLFTDSALTEGMSDLFLSSLKTSVYRIEIDKSEDYVDLLIYKEGYRAVFVSNAMSTDVIMLGAQLSANLTRVTAYYKPLCNDTSGTGYIEFTVYYVEAENEETEGIEVASISDYTGDVNWTSWTVANTSTGIMYADNNYNYYAYHNGKASGTYSAGDGFAQLVYSSKADTTYSNYQSYYTSGYINMYWVYHLPMKKKLTRIKWKSRNNSEYSKRWIVVVITAAYPSKYYVTGTESVVYAGIASQSGIITTELSATVPKGYTIRIYGNGIAISELTLTDAD